MWLTNLSIRRPIVILMIFSAVIILALTARSRMPIDLYPNVDFPYLLISTVYPGAGPEEVESQVTKPIEDSIGSVSGINEIMSTSQESLSVVGIEFELGTNLDAAAADVRARVDAARRFMPQDADTPVIQKIDVGAMPVLRLGMSSERPSIELRMLADEVIRDRLSRISGVAAVTITGGDQREIQVNVDRGRLEAYGLSMHNVAQALAAGNMNLPGGTITEGGRDFSIRAIGEFNSIDEIRNLQIGIPGMQGLSVIRLGDIAEILDTAAERDEITRLQRQDSIGILVTKQADANTVEVVDGVKEELESMKNMLPEDISIAVVFDQSVQVREALADVNTSLILGAILAVIIVFLFLHSLRGTFIVAVAIPVCMIATFLPIYFAGFTMNMMTMLALALAIGILIDGSIVVLENIYRHLGQGKEPKKAASEGLGEIGTAVLSITMIDVVVFIPIAFMGGIVGMFFKEFGVTVVSASIFSLIVAFTLTPMLASRLYRKDDAVEAKEGFFLKFDNFYEALRNRYKGFLDHALARRSWVIGGSFAFLLIVLVVGGRQLGMNFFPSMDQGEIKISVEMPTDTSIEVTSMVAAQIEDMITDIPEVEYILSNVGSTGGMMGLGSRGANIAQITAALHEKESAIDRILRPFRREDKRIRSDQMIAAEIREMLTAIPGGEIRVVTSSGMGGGGGSPIDLELTGGTDEERNTVSQEILAVLQSTEGILNPDMSWRIGKPEIRAVIDKTRSAHYGLTVGQIASAVRVSIEGSAQTKFRDRGEEYDIRVRLNELDRHSVSDLSNLIVGSFNGSPVYLMDVSAIDRDTGPTMIERKDGQRKVSVTASVAPGYDLAGVQRSVMTNIRDINMGDVQIHGGGEFEMMQESFGRMLGALLLSIALVYMVLAALFESLFFPFIIMITLPIALVGAIIALVVAGEDMSMVAMIGIIMLMGLVGKNAVVLVDYINTLRSRGMERKEAILEAGATRLRPIMMMSLAMIFAMLPTALKLGRGAEMRAQMAIAVIGGLIFASLVTLFVIPALYTVFDDVMNKYLGVKSRLLDRKKKIVETPEPEASAE